ncbi:MAG: tRNA guanosine(34) transglycosylase Tgt [Planctomycetota bacterium]|nr:MAG: tRNA guanosine(34) transglycosylase Tgt [Planctomycetota bacterium]
MAFSLEATRGAARAGRLVLPHAVVPTPVFMAVGTRATVKACTTDQVVDTGTRILLGNTFHLGLKPGAERVAAAGGLHAFARWPHAMLTDSGGYQVFSLADLRRLGEEGVRFKSPYDGTLLELTPERSIEIQNLLGADIIMAFDECAPYPATREAVLAAVERTTRWAERCLRAHARPDAQALFGIVQGGVHADLRARSADALVAMDFPGYAIGGLSVGEGPERMDATLEATCPLLPEDRPRYLMGVGKPEDLVRAVLRGVDMFDCALPTRNARNGEVFLWPRRYLRLKHARYRDDHRVIDPLCDCLACRTGVKRSYLAHLLRVDEIAGLTYCSLHNLRFYQRLMQRLRREIVAGTLDAFRAEFFAPEGSGQPAD